MVPSQDDHLRGRQNERFEEKRRRPDGGFQSDVLVMTSSSFVCWADRWREYLVDDAERLTWSCVASFSSVDHLRQLHGMRCQHRVSLASPFWNVPAS